MMEVAAVAAAAGGCVLSGWLAALLWRRPAERRARAELRRLGDLVQLHARAAQQAEEQRRLEYVRAELAAADAQQAELRARVAEDEAELLRVSLALHEATACALCGKPPPLCQHGREERIEWLREHGGGFPVQLPAAAFPPRGPRRP